MAGTPRQRLIFSKTHASARFAQTVLRKVLSAMATKWTLAWLRTSDYTLASWLATNPQLD